MESTRLEVNVPGVPVPYTRVRFGQGKAYNTKRYTEWKKAITWVAMSKYGNQKPLEGPVSMMVRAVLPIPNSWSKKKQAAATEGERQHTSTPDIDNLAKAGMDALNGILYRDDKQIVNLRVFKLYGENPGLQIVVSQ